MKTVLLLLTGSLLFSASADLVVCTWTGEAGDGKWMTPENWDTGVVPKSGWGAHTAVISSAGLTPGADGVAVIEVEKNVEVTQLKIAAGSGALRVTGAQLTVTQNCGFDGTITASNAAIVDNAAGVPVEVACDLYTTGQRAILLGENCDFTLSGAIKGSGTATHYQKYGPASSRFVLSGDIDFPGYTSGSYVNATVTLRGGTNVIAGVAANGGFKAGTTVRFGSHWVGGVNTTIEFGAGVYLAKIDLVNCANLTLYFAGDSTFKENFTNTYRSDKNTWTYYLDSAENAKVNFEKDFDLTGASLYIQLRDGTDITVDGGFLCTSMTDIDARANASDIVDFHLNGPVSIKSSIYTRYYNLVFGADGAMQTFPLLTWGYRSTNQKGVIDLNGHSQTIGGINSTVTIAQPGNPGRLLTTSSPATIVLADNADHSALSTQLRGPLTLVYAPTGKYTMSFKDGTYAATGDIVVSNGTLRLEGESAYRDVREIRVTDGGTFELDSTKAGSLTHVRRIYVERGGVFRMTARAANPFAGLQPPIVLEDGAALDVPADAGFSPENVTVAGVRVTPGRYQSPDGTDPTATKVPWVSGPDVVEVFAGGTNWKSSENGAWGVAENWDAGVPSAARAAHLWATGDSYTVTVGADAGSVAGLSIGNLGTDTTTLAVAAPMSFVPGSRLELADGARLAVGAGGKVEHVTPVAASYANPDEVYARVGAGAEWTVTNGGDVNISNYVGRIVVEGVEGNPAKLTVDGATFRYHAANTVYSQMELGPHAELLVTNGTVRFDSTGKTWNYMPFCQRGGTITVAGDSTVSVSRSDARIFGDGETVLKDNALLTTDIAYWNEGFYPSTFVGPTASGATSTVHFVDHARFYTEKYSCSTRFQIGDDHGIYGGEAVTGGLAVVVYDSDLESRFGSYLAIGSDYCRGELHLNSGKMSVSYSSLEVGAGNPDWRTSRADARGEGLLVMNGGSMQIRNGNYSLNTRNLTGLVVGGGWLTVVDGNGSYHGRIELNGGSLMTMAEMNHVIVGPGRSRGEIVQTGGEFVHNGSDGDTKFAMAIGFENGTGSYVISNGTATVRNNLYVGGVDQSVLGYNLQNCPLGDQAVGLLSVCGGTFTVTNSLIASADGTGTVEIGGAGTLNVGKDLDLQTSANGGNASTLRFAFGPDGIGKLAVDGDLKIADNAKLVVDMSGYTGRARSFRFMEVGGATVGSFASVQFVPPSVPGGENLKLVEEDGVYRVKNDRGLCILVR